MSERQIQSDHYPEITENNKAMRRLELAGGKEIFSNTQERREFFANLDDEKFQKLFGYINSITRGEIITDKYEDGQMQVLSTPAFEEKGSLMKEAFSVAREILHQDLLNDETALRHAALTLAGAVNYIHPYKDGNGRVGRIVHYLLEYGSERGGEAFNNELYAVIAKLPVYDGHSGNAIHNMPPLELTHALDDYAQEQLGEKWQQLDKQTQASARVQTFLNMMRRSITVPVNEQTIRSRRDPISNESIDRLITPPGSLDGLTLYENEFLDRSSVPHYRPEDIPPDTTRVMAVRPDRHWEKIIEQGIKDL